MEFSYCINDRISLGNTTLNVNREHTRFEYDPGNIANDSAIINYSDCIFRINLQQIRFTQRIGACDISHLHRTRGFPITLPQLQD